MKRELPPVVATVLATGFVLFCGYIGIKSCDYLSQDFKRVEWPEGSSGDPVNRSLTVGGVALHPFFPDSISGIPVTPDEPLQNIILTDK